MRLYVVLVLPGRSFGEDNLPTLSQFFQPPQYWQQFEELAQGLLREVYDSPNSQQLGRPGQAQDGVDVFGHSKRFGRIGIQCKRLADRDAQGNPLPGGPINKTVLREEAASSLGFPSKLSLWILATTARRDAAVQRWVNELNDEWSNKGHDCHVMVWAWDDIVGYLNAFPNLQRWYYQSVIKVRGDRDLDDFILATIRMAFARPAFEVPLHCESPVEFLHALSDTQRAVRTGELVDRESRHVIRKAVGGWHEVSDRDVRQRLGEVNRLLRHLRTELAVGLKDGRILKTGDLLDFTDQQHALDLEQRRGKCIAILNDVLRSRGMDPVD